MPDTVPVLKTNPRNRAHGLVDPRPAAGPPASGVAGPLTALLVFAPLLAWVLLVVGGTLVIGVATYAALIAQMLLLALLLAFADRRRGAR